MSNLPIKVPTLKLYRGDSFFQSFVFKNASTGVVRDLVSEGWSDWTAQWRPNIDSNNYVNFTVDALQANVGLISIELTPEQTTALRNGVWDLQAIQNGIVKTWLAGKLELTKDVTHV